VTKSSHHRALWSCEDCGDEWRARVNNRTNSKRPTGCPGCAGKVPTETNNLKLACKESGGRLAHLLVEWNHLTKRMEDFAPASAQKVPWKCGCGHEWDARISSRTRSDRPRGCPACAGQVATEINNLRLTCKESGGGLRTCWWSGTTSQRGWRTLHPPLTRRCHGSAGAGMSGTPG
jgi:hypothetical protein